MLTRYTHCGQCNIKNIALTTVRISCYSIPKFQKSSDSFDSLGITVIPACMCRPIIEFSQAVYIIDPGFHGYQPEWATWYIALIPHALVLCLIYTHAPSSLRPSGLCVYIRQSTRACGISIIYIMNILWTHHLVP